VQKGENIREKGKKVKEKGRKWKEKELIFLHDFINLVLKGTIGDKKMEYQGGKYRFRIKI
jgi:hypothetical protein